MLGSRTPSDARVVRDILSGKSERLEVLIDRYAGAVYGIAYAYVRNHHDAQDVLQESFTQAYRELESLRKPERFKSWLFTIARNTARRALKKSRRVRDAVSLGDEDVVEPKYDFDGRELLHEALDTLGASYREVLVLHYFGGMSTREIARDLGESREAIKKRLQRARESLGETLMARLRPAGDYATPSEEHRAALLGGVLTASVAVTAGRHAAATTNAGGSSILLGLRLPHLAAGAILVGTALGFFVGSPRSVTGEAGSDVLPPLPIAQTLDSESTSTSDIVLAEADDPEVDQRENSASADATEAEVEFSVTGTVVNPEGEPVASANVLIFHDTSTRGLHDRIAGETTTDGDGRFGFEEPLIFLREADHHYQQDVFLVTASHPDFAFDWRILRPGDDTTDITLTLTPPVGRTMSVVDADGDPMKGATVWVMAAGTGDDPVPRYRDYFNVNTFLPVAAGDTDETGTAYIPNTPDTNLAYYVSKPGYADVWSSRANRTVTLTRGATVSGRVLDEDDAPLAGAEIRMVMTFMSGGRRALTDEDGAFTFTELPANGWDMSTWGKGKTGSGEYDLVLHHGKFHAIPQKLALSPGEVISGLEIRARTGTLVRCQVVTMETGEPMAGARIQAYSNGSKLDGYTDSNGYVSWQVSPGEMTLLFMSPPDGVWAINPRGDEGWGIARQIFLTASGPQTNVTMTAPPIGGPLTKVTGTVRTPSGVSASSVVVHVIGSNLHVLLAGKSGYFDESGVNPDGTFMFADVPVGLPIHFYAQTRDRRYAGLGTHTLTGGDNPTNTVSLSLRETATATFSIDPDLYTPGESARIEIALKMGEAESFRTSGSSQFVAVDPDGTFTAKGILPGQTYSLIDSTIDPETQNWKLYTSAVLIPE